MRFVFLARLFALVSAALAAGAAEPVDVEAEKRLVVAAESARDAFFVIRSPRVGLGEDDLIAHRGYFISSDGLAIIPLQAFDGGQFSTALESDETPITLAGVVAANLEASLAIVRTDHRPAKWLTLLPEDLAVGARVGIYRHPDHGGTLTAPIVARRKVAFGRSRAYNEVHSIAANLGDLGSTHVPAGTPVFDESGQVAATLTNPQVTPQQRFLFGFPVSLILPHIPEDTRKAATVPFPLPNAYRPADPLAMNGTYLLGRRAQVSGQPVEAERLLRRALSHEPESAAGWERLGFVLRELKRDKDAREAFDRAAELGKRLGGFQLNRADQYRLEGQLDKAAEVLRAATASIPFDYELHRAYAIALRLQGDEAGAEKHLHLATQLAPDALSCWELLSQCLAAQAKWDEEKEVSDKIYEIEALYRPR